MSNPEAKLTEDFFAQGPVDGVPNHRLPDRVPPSAPQAHLKPVFQGCR